MIFLILKKYDYIYVQVQTFLLGKDMGKTGLDKSSKADLGVLKQKRNEPQYLIVSLVNIET